MLPQLQKGEVSYIKLKQIQYRNRIRIKSEEPSHQENLRSDVEKNVYGEENIRNEASRARRARRRRRRRRRRPSSRSRR